MNATAPDFSRTPLLPAIVRDARTGAVLMLAWMNEESFRRTEQTGETWFWSRSRNELWNKGASSGNRQKVVRVGTDCDRDAILIDVEPLGPACHTGAVSCFGDRGRFDLDGLMELLRSRKARRPAGSYASRLFDGGIDRILSKVGEEATEVVIAGASQGRQRLVEEASDLLFHLLVLLVEKDISLSDIEAELASRAGSRREASAEVPS